MDDDDRYSGVLAALSNIASEWRIYRDTINRAINLLNHEVLALVDQKKTDDAARAKRQEQLDATLKSIIDGQAQMRSWQWIRLGVEIAAILIIAAFLFGVSR